MAATQGLISIKPFNIINFVIREGKNMREPFQELSNFENQYDMDPVLIDLKNAVNHPVGRRLISLVKHPVEALLSIGKLNSLYAQVCRRTAALHSPDEIFNACLEACHVTYQIGAGDLEKIPTKGALIAVANHPFGGIEGVILAAILSQVRPDLKILGNYLLTHIQPIKEHIISVDPFDNNRSKTANTRGLKDALRWLKNGGILEAFPAGEVSSLRLNKAKVMDPPWSPHIGALVRHTRAAVLPVFFPGSNSLLFQLLGLLHPRLRTAMLPRELVNKQFRSIKVYIGRPIPWGKLKKFKSDQALTEYLRINTYFQKHRKPSPFKPFKTNTPIPLAKFVNRNQSPSEPVINPVSPEILQREINQLSSEQHLLENGDFDVFIAESSQVPNLLNEIGRLREITFREVQEGTGKSIDLDRFDSYYRHLFLWNRKKKILIGAYRLGLTDQILDVYGTKGLYSSELFHYKYEFVHRLQTAVEFGRSFIRSEYQKKFNSLMLIWRGIGEFVVQNPQYKILFGPVSISRDYHSVSKNLMVRFLKQNKFDNTLSKYVSARHPYRSVKLTGVDKQAIKSSFQDIDDISLLVSEIEKDGKGIPVLLRHYLKLNGTLVSFNVDKAFSNVVDGLLIVDLSTTDPKLLKRFMGPDGYQTFTRYYARRPLPDGTPDRPSQRFFGV